MIFKINNNKKNTKQQTIRSQNYKKLQTTSTQPLNLCHGVTNLLQIICYKCYKLLCYKSGSRSVGKLAAPLIPFLTCLLFYALLFFICCFFIFTIFLSFFQTFFRHAMIAMLHKLLFFLFLTLKESRSASRNRDE